MKLLGITLLLVFVIATQNIQADEIDSSDIQVSYFKGSISYLSNAVYYGRKDTLKMPYLTPAIGYYFKSGFYLDASLSYLTRAPGRIDLVTLEGGYDLNVGDNFNSEFTASKYFYSVNSASAKSNVTGEVSASATYTTSLISINTGIDISFSNKTDFIVNYGISHPFYIGKEGNQWTIEPSILSYAGTQKFQGKAAEKLLAKGIKITGADSFVILDYEFSVPISFDKKKWGLSFTPTYSIPLNPITLTRLNGKVRELQSLSNSFYAEIAVYLKF